MMDPILIVSSALVRLRARRLPVMTSLRMEEEWLGEMSSIPGRSAKLAFAVSLLLTRRQAFVAPGEDTVVTIYDRPSLGSRKSLVVLSTVVFAIAAYSASFLLPVKYESEALLVSEDRDDLVLRQARSNSFFAKVAEDMRLEPRERMIEDLSKNVTVVPLIDSSSSTTSFLVKYRGDNPRMSQQVTNGLASSLIGLNMEKRMGQLFEEANYLQAQLEQLEDRVRIKAEQLAHAGPESRGILALDHELLVSSYKALFAKHQDAQMAAALQPARFQVLDRAQVGKPIGPNRAAFAGIGALGGFVLAVLAVAGRGRRQPPAVTVPA
jgi:uncharacterized protein involved in exopolysaccharide biosynthesis